eukprot:Gb_14899 [translate_table: standard]
MARAIEVACEILPTKGMSRIWGSVDAAAAVKGALPITASAGREQNACNDDEAKQRKKYGFVMGRGCGSHVYHDENSAHAHSSGGGHGFKSHSFALHRMSGEGSNQNRLWQWRWRWRKSADGQGLIAGSCGGWMNILCKTKKMVMTSSTSRQPATASKFKYDALSYAQNFDDGCWQDEECSRSFSSRFACPNSFPQ